MRVAVKRLITIIMASLWKSNNWRAKDV